MSLPKFTAKQQLKITPREKNLEKGMIIRNEINSRLHDSRNIQKPTLHSAPWLQAVAKSPLLRPKTQLTRPKSPLPRPKTNKRDFIDENKARTRHNCCKEPQQARNDGKPPQVQQVFKYVPKRAKAPTRTISSVEEQGLGSPKSPNQYSRESSVCGRRKSSAMRAKKLVYCPGLRSKSPRGSKSPPRTVIRDYFNVNQGRKESAGQAAKPPEISTMMISSYTLNNLKQLSLSECMHMDIRPSFYRSSARGSSTSCYGNRNSYLNFNLNPSYPASPIKPATPNRSYT